DEDAFRANVEQVNPGVDIVLTSARRGQGTGAVLDRALAAASGEPPHRPVMARATHTHAHAVGDLTHTHS
ncbi:hydrogenase nickel incorporation protein HypB, partial [Streptomyces sp. NPDC002920]